MTGNGNGNGSASLKGRVALVTGAAKGIGRAIALQLAHRGAAVAVNYRSSKAEAETLAIQLHEMGVDYLVIQGDVAVSAEARRVVKEVLDAFGRLDILVNNAGITRDHSIAKMTEDDWVEVINTNLNAAFYCTSAAVPAMIQQKFGRIINVGSLVGQAGNFGQANYAASKGGLTAFTKSLALELARHNITANVIAPGFTCTEMTARIPAEVLEQIRSKIPLRRFANPDEIGKAAAFLASDADYVTGTELSINGGMHM